MALANVAVLMVQWGHKVLVVDWDLEAPGLDRYFDHLPPSSAMRPGESAGIVEIAHAIGEDQELGWKDSVVTFAIPGARQNLDFLPAGRKDSEYARRLQQLDWEELFRRHDFGNHLENIRNEWLRIYDYILIDSRTGISDIGGICTIYLPDILVAMFTSNHQSVEGVAEVVDRARNARSSLPVDRGALVCVPVPSRDESRTEYEQSQEWRRVYERLLGQFYADFLPRDISAADALDLLRVPSVPYWSFGEKLPVLTESPSDPSGITYYYTILARLLTTELSWHDSTPLRSSAARDLAKGRDVQIESVRSARDEPRNPVRSGQEQQAHFVGRAEHLGRILSGDSTDRTPGLDAAFFDVEGIPGIGKTSLLDKLARTVKEEHSAAGEQEIIQIRIDCGDFPARGRAPSSDATAEFRQFRALLRGALESLPDDDDISNVLNYLTLNHLTEQSTRPRPGFEGSGQTWTPSDPVQVMNAADDLRDLAARAVNRLAQSLAARRARLLILVDDFHLVAGRPLGQWVMEWLNGIKGADVVVTHRQFRDPTMPPRAVQLPLGNLEFADVRAYLESYLGVGPDVEGMVEPVWNFTAGHPQALALVTDLIKESGSPENAVGLIRQLGALQGGMPARLRALVDRVFDAIGDEELRDALFTLCVTHHFDAPLLERLLGVDERRAQTLIDRLGNYSFVESGTADRSFLSIGDFVRYFGESYLSLARRQAIHIQAADYYHSLIVAMTAEDETSHESWSRYAQRDFQTLERDWLYHTSRLTGPNRQKARIGLTRIFLDAFWFWGCYVPFSFCEEILADWADATSNDAEDRSWGTALRTLYDRYPKGWRKSDAPREQWTEVRRALRYIWVRGDFGQDQLEEPEMRHMRGILDFFLADAARFVDPGDREADARLNDAAQQFAANDDEWGVAWIGYARADLAISRGQADLAMSLARESAERYQDLDDQELLANLHRVCGDAQWLRGEPGAALDAYARAVLHAYRLQVESNPDDYTDTFQREMIDRSVERLTSWHADERDAGHMVLRAACARIHAFFGPYWRATGTEPAADVGFHVVRALDEGRDGDVAGLLFPAGPTIADLNRPGSEYELIGTDVAYQMVHELAQPPGSPLPPTDSTSQVGRGK
jgi:cellulose biosynthesis protein BcsQ